MRMVIKIAGALLERDEDVQSIARQIAELARAGHELLVIHGGGKIFTATLARMGITSRFINGLRVTDRETRDAAVMVFAGLLNKKLAGAISLAGQPAVGISAARRRLLSRRADAGGRARGQPRLCRLPHRSERGFSPLALARRASFPWLPAWDLGADGELYNINADHMAAAAAEFIRADRLIFLTDVAGVLDGDKVLRALRGTDIEDLIRTQQSFRRNDSETRSREARSGRRRLRSAHRRRHAARALARRSQCRTRPGNACASGDPRERQGRARSSAIAMAKRKNKSATKRSRRPRFEPTKRAT